MTGALGTNEIGAGEMIPGPDPCRLCVGQFAARSQPT